jgi:RNA polymerase sigma factor (sigma-70 family)
MMEAQEPKDEELVLRARSGDEAAWDELVAKHSKLIGAVARSYRLSSVDAADVVQNVWVKLLENLQKIRDPAAIRGWLATTTMRESLVVVQLRSKHVDLPVEEFRLSDLEAAAALNNVTTVTDVRRILRDIAHSKDETLFQIVVYMLDHIQITGEAPSNRLIARTCGLSHPAVGKALTRLQPYFKDLQGSIKRA